jgi:hypothetical protein
MLADRDAWWGKLTPLRPQPALERDYRAERDGDNDVARLDELTARVDRVRLMVVSDQGAASRQEGYTREEEEPDEDHDIVRVVFVVVIPC